MYYLATNTILLVCAGICVVAIFYFFKLLSGVEALSPPP